jgi:hypothetical protein
MYVSTLRGLAIYRVTDPEKPERSASSRAALPERGRRLLRDDAA